MYMCIRIHLHACISVCCMSIVQQDFAVPQHETDGTLDP